MTIVKTKGSVDTEWRCMGHTCSVWCAGPLGDTASGAWGSLPWAPRKERALVEGRRQEKEA